MSDEELQDQLAAALSRFYQAFYDMPCKTTEQFDAIDQARRALEWHRAQTASGERRA